MKVLKITSNKDGSATIDYEITKIEKELIKKALNVDKLTINMINKFVIDGLTKLMDKSTNI